MIELTDIEGLPVYIHGEYVCAILTPAKCYKGDTKAIVVLGNGFKFFVLETPEEVNNKIRGWGDNGA